MSDIDVLKTEIKQIKERNTNVEADKAWETSNTRRVLLILITYFLVGLYLTFLKVQDPWLNALVPAAGFFLSTLTLGLLKYYWVKNIYRRGDEN